MSDQRCVVESHGGLLYQILDSYVYLINDGFDDIDDEYNYNDYYIPCLLEIMILEYSINDWCLMVHWLMDV